MNKKEFRNIDKIGIMITLLTLIGLIISHSSKAHGELSTLLAIPLILSLMYGIYFMFTRLI